MRIITTYKYQNEDGEWEFEVNSFENEYNFTDPVFGRELYEHLEYILDGHYLHQRDAKRCHVILKKREYKNIEIIKVTLENA